MGWKEDGRIAQAEDRAANGDSNGSAVYDPTKFDEDGKPRRKGIYPLSFQGFPLLNLDPQILLAKESSFLLQKKCELFTKDWLKSRFTNSGGVCLYSSD